MIHSGSDVCLGCERWGAGVSPRPRRHSRWQSDGGEAIFPNHCGVPVSSNTHIGITRSQGRKFERPSPTSDNAVDSLRSRQTYEYGGCVSPVTYALGVSDPLASQSRVSQPAGSRPSMFLSGVVVAHVATVNSRKDVVGGALEGLVPGPLLASIGISSEVRGSDHA